MTDTSQPPQSTKPVAVLLDLIYTLCIMFIAQMKAILYFFISPPEKKIDGKIILITGGGNGIGRLMAQELAKKKSIVVSWDLNEDWNNETKRLIEQDGGTCYIYTVNVSNREAVLKCAQQVEKEVGKVDILINNAGIVSGKRLTDLTEQAIQRTFQVNTMAHFWTLQAFLPAMISEDSGHIVTISSIAGHMGGDSLTDYCASKFAIVGMHESLNFELMALGRWGVKTTLVCPYHIKTALFTGFKGRFDLSLEPEYVAKRTVKAILTDQRLLCMPRAAYGVNYIKAVLSVDGCMALNRFLGITHVMETFVGRTDKDKST